MLVIGLPFNVFCGTRVYGPRPNYWSLGSEPGQPRPNLTQVASRLKHLHPGNGSPRPRFSPMEGNLPDPKNPNLPAFNTELSASIASKDVFFPESRNARHREPGNCPRVGLSRFSLQAPKNSGCCSPLTRTLSLKIPNPKTLEILHERHNRTIQSKAQPLLPKGCSSEGSCPHAQGFMVVKTKLCLRLRVPTRGSYIGTLRAK